MVTHRCLALSLIEGSLDPRGVALPAWVPDEEAAVGPVCVYGGGGGGSSLQLTPRPQACDRCAMEFSIFVRRHHVSAVPLLLCCCARAA